MSIEPLPPSYPREISITEPMTAAYERVKLILFRPFDLGKWFVIGFCAWLAGLADSGGYHGSFNNNFGSKRVAQPLADFRHYYGVAHDYVLLNLVWLVPVAAMLVLILLGLAVLLIWLSSRGKFIFLHCVALNRAEVEIPWEKYGAVANRLFWFRLGLWLAGMVLTLPLLFFIGVLGLKLLLQQDEFNFMIFMPLIGLGLGVVLLSMVFLLVQKLLIDFVVPILYLRGGGCLDAWREFFRLFGGQVGNLLLYLLFQIVLAMLIGMLVIMVVLLTCCVAGCFLAIPYIGTVLLLPILIFKRAYSLHYLAQFGPPYDVFPPAPPVSTAPPPGLQPL